MFLINNLKTECHSDFSISSNGEIKEEIGFVAAENSFFDPDYITAKLGIEPHKTYLMGSLHKNRRRKCPFSSWEACYQDEPVFDAEEQCLKIVNILKDKVPELLEIKRNFNVSFMISVTPHIRNEEQPLISFNSEIIDFCHATGTTITVDIYVYDSGSGGEDD